MDGDGGTATGGRGGAGPVGARERLRHQLTDHAFLRAVWTNEAEVAPGVWRSNQPTAARLRRLRARGLCTVISLRGDGRAPHQALLREGCAAAGLRLIPVALNARRAPTREQVAALFAAFRAAERPLLLHCKSGADRTGFAAALWLLRAGAPLATARAQLAPRFLHFRWTRAGVLDRVLDLYGAAADARGGLPPVEEWFAAAYDPGEAA
jgi:uncharacterized protein (TIGR01244 family)